jgi:hypothetical protein
MRARLLPLLLVVIALLLGACASGDAVVFAPTPLPPDQSPVVYTHPGGAFTVEVPRHWALHEQYTTQLATASFTPPGGEQPLLRVSVVRLDDATARLPLAELLDRYQTQARPDAGRYTETARAPMGDGSWRLSGFREGVGGRPEALNTFIELDGGWMAVTDLLLPPDAETLAALEAAANSVRLTPPGTLEAAPLSAFSAARSADLDIVHTSAWTTPDGVFYVSGEVANTGSAAVGDVPVEVGLYDAAGVLLSGAADRVMGYIIPPGGYAPFSLRFGGGQPEAAREFRVRVGGPEWTPQPSVSVAGAQALSWTDSATFEADNQLTVSGEVTNTGAALVEEVRVVVTVFNAAQEVVGAAWATLQPPALGPGESAPYRFVFNELGGAAVNYIVQVQGLSGR